MKPLVSIVIPSYNRADDLKRALRSVSAQTYSNWEVIVVDNNSNDNTDDVLQSFNESRIRLFKIHNNGVIAASRNKGIRKARGEYIAFLDSDDWWMPQKLEVSMQSLEQGYDVFYHDLWGVKQESGQVFKKRMKGRHVSEPVYADLINKGNAISTSSVVVRKEVLQKVSGQSEDPELIAAEDFECWLRISRVTERFIYIPVILGYYWMGAENMSNAKRSLINLKRLQTLHIEPYNKENNPELPVWWEYAFARATYLVGETLAARKLLQRLIKRGSVPWLLLLKARFMLARPNRKIAT